MIQVEYLNDNTLIKHYSDSGMMLLQEETGMKYSEAVDVIPCRYTYIETDEPIDLGDDSEITEEEFFDMIEEVL